MKLSIRWATTGLQGVLPSITNRDAAAAKGKPNRRGLVDRDLMNELCAAIIATYIESPEIVKSGTMSA